MAITHLLTPQVYCPAHNPIVAAFTSDKQNEEGFNFVTNLYHYEQFLVTPRIDRDKRPPNPDGYGVIDFSTTLSDYVSYDLYPNLTGCTAASGSAYNFLYVVGEEYIEKWPYKYSVNNGGFVQFSSSTVHSFTTGDRLYFTMTGTTTYPYYNGPHTVTSVPNSQSVVIDVPYGGATSLEGGLAHYADRRKTEFSGSTTFIVHTAYNAAYSHLNFISYTGSSILMGTNTDAYFLTDMPLSGWKQRTDSRMMLDFMLENGGTYGIFITTKNGQSNNTLTAQTYTITASTVVGGFVGFEFVAPPPSATTFTWWVDPLTPGIDPPYSGTGQITGFAFGSWITNIPTSQPPVSSLTNGQANIILQTGTAQGMYYLTGNTFTSPYFNRVGQAGLGPWNLNNAGGAGIVSISGSTLPPIKSDTTSYEFSMYTNYGTGQTLASQLYEVDIDRRCNYFISDRIQLLFKDLKGSFNSFTFELKNTKTTDISRTEFRKQVGSFNAATSTWGYNSQDRGRTVFNVDAQERYVAHSNWITDDNMEYLSELFTSPEVYWVMNDGNTIPVVITSKSFDHKKRLNDRLVNATIEFEPAFNNNINV